MSKKHSPLANMQAIIFGSSGQVGMMMANLLENIGLTSISGIDKHNSSHSLQQFFHGDVVSFNYSQLSRYNIIVLSIPFRVFRDVAQSIFSYIPSDTIIIDLFSTKSSYFELVSFYQSQLSKTFSLLSINPLFKPGPDIGSKKYVYIKCQSNGTVMHLLKKMKETTAHFIEISSAAEHDQIMSLLQVIPHFSIIVAASVILNYPASSDRLFDASTFFSDKFIMLMRRILEGNPHVYYEIQKQNPIALAMRECFISVAEHLNRVINEDDEKCFNEYVKKLLRLLPNNH